MSPAQGVKQEGESKWHNGAEQKKKKDRQRREKKRTEARWVAGETEIQQKQPYCRIGEIQTSLQTGKGQDEKMRQRLK